MKKFLYTLGATIVALVIIANIPCDDCSEPKQARVILPADVSIYTAWSYLQDFSTPHFYVPNLIRTEMVSERSRGVGAHRRVYMSESFYTDETILEWDEGRGFLMKLHDGDKPMPPFSSAQFRYQLDPIAAERTMITLTMEVSLPWGRVGDALATLMAKYMLPRTLAEVAAGMKIYYETGRMVSDTERAAVVSLVDTI